MRRASSARSGSFTSSSDGEQGFWPSYADMMSAVALILFFLMLISYIQNLITGNDLKKTQDTLNSTQAQLLLTLQDVQTAEDELQSVTSDLDSAKMTLTEKETEIARPNEELQQQLALIDQQKLYLTQADEEIKAMHAQMETIAGLRVSILEQIRDKIAEVMGDPSKVSIGDTGNIILSDSVLFDVGSSEIKPESVPLLNRLVEVFMQFLSDSENAQYVESIVISGHTDSTGNAEENRVLSTSRANSVLNYLLVSQNGKLGAYAQMFCAAGYGATRPVQDNYTAEGRAANRRIEISMILKDDTVMEIINNYLAIELPKTDSSSAAAASTGG
mgnify:FL=1